MDHRARDGRGNRLSQQSGGLSRGQGGLLGGMAGAAEYEDLRLERGMASRGMDAQSLAHLFIVLCIVLGNLAQWERKRKETA